MSLNGLIAPCVKSVTDEPSFDRNLGLPEALGMSLSIVGPSMAMAGLAEFVIRNSLEDANKENGN